MGDLTKRIINRLQTGNLINDLDAICLAAELICKTTFINYFSGFDEVEEEEITSQEAEELENSVILALERYCEQNEPEVVSSLLWALQKTRKSQYKKIYQEYLQRGFKNFLSYNQMVYHTLLALSDCEEKITVLDWEKDRDGTSHTSLSYSDYDKIALLARKYLTAISKSPNEQISTRYGCHSLRQH